MKRIAMRRNRHKSAPGLECLDGRVLLSAGMSAGPKVVAEVARRTVDLKVAVRAGTLGQPITFQVDLRTAAASGPATGTVDILDQGRVVKTIPLKPATNANPRFAFATGSVTLDQPAGSAAVSLGRHVLTARYNPAGSLPATTVAAAFNIRPPAYTVLPHGVKIARIVEGSGAAIAAGQTAHVLYTGYLAKNGTLFDYSNAHGGSSLAFPVGVGQVIPGFDAGILGMKVGETRIVFIPSSQGYGRTPNGPIPANSNLVFLVKLTSIG